MTIDRYNKGKRCENRSYLEYIWCLNECVMNKYDTLKRTSGKWFSLSLSFFLIPFQAHRETDRQTVTGIHLFLRMAHRFLFIFFHVEKEAKKRKTKTTKSACTRKRESASSQVVSVLPSTKLVINSTSSSLADWWLHRTLSLTLYAWMWLVWTEIWWMIDHRHRLFRIAECRWPVRWSMCSQLLSCVWDELESTHAHREKESERQKETSKVNFMTRVESREEMNRHTVMLGLGGRDRLRVYHSKSRDKRLIMCMITSLSY